MGGGSEGRRARILERTHVDFSRLGAEAAQDDASQGGVVSEPGGRRPDRDSGRARNREAVNPGGDGRERDGLRAMVGREPERLPVAALEKGVLVVVASPPYRSGGVDDVVGGEVVPAGDAGLASRASAEPPTLLKEARAGGAMDRTVHPASAEKRLVRGVDDHVHLEPRDIAFDDFDPIRCAHVSADGVGGRCWI